MFGKITDREELKEFGETYFNRRCFSRVACRPSKNLDVMVSI